MTLSHRPSAMTHRQAMNVLRDFADRFASGDCSEGHIAIEADYDTDRYMVKGMYRIGTRGGGQGGMRMVGFWE